MTEVLAWPQVECTPPIIRSPDLISIHLKQAEGAIGSSAATSVREFAKVYLEAATIHLTLPLVAAPIFSSLLEARLVLEQWRADYNTARPHSGLGNLPPAAFPGADVQPVTNNNNALQTAKS